MEIDVNPQLRRREMVRNDSYYYMRYMSTESREWQHVLPPLVPLCAISEQEYVTYYREAYARRTAPVRLESCRPQDRITDYDRQKALIPIRNTSTGAQLDMMFENQVYVVRFCDKYTKRRYLFNLEAMAIRLAACGVEYSTKKFTKITLRYLNGPSHLFFASGRMLETGTYNAAIARKSLDHTMTLLRELGHYENIEIERRRCENIVAKGSLKFELCLLLLCDMYPTCATYGGTHGFVGAIIRLRRMQHKRQQHRQQKQHHHHHRHKRRRLCLDDDDDDDEDDDGEKKRDDHGDDDEEAEYEFIDAQNQDEIYNSGFERFIVSESLARELASEAAADEELCVVPDVVNVSSSSSSTQAPRRNKLLGVMRDPEEMEEADVDEVTRGAKKNNVTIIVFGKGKIICAGCKTERSVLMSCARVLPMLEACKKTPRNLLLEKEIRERSVYSSVISK